jgi:hypothetical protein
MKTAWQVLGCLALLAVHASVALAATANQFLVAPTYSVGKSPSAVVVADFNGDNIQDLAVFNNYGHSRNTPSISVLLGNGDGTFRRSQTIEFVSASPNQQIVAADFNRDGKIDLAALDINEGFDIFPGNGDGTFQSPSFYSTGLFDEYGFATGDLNGDGAPDLLIGGGSYSAVLVVLNNGDGTFGAPTTYFIPGYSYSLVVGDFNGDGKLDVAATGELGHALVSVLLGNGDGTLQPAVGYPAGKAVYVNVGDFNNDQHLDLIVTTDTGLSVLLGNGDGTFGSPITVSLGHMVGVTAGDFNGDGKLDAAVSGSSNVFILLGNGDGTFQPSPLTYGLALHPSLRSVISTGTII